MYFLKRKPIVQKNLIFLVLVFSFVSIFILQPQVTFAFNNKKDGERLLNEYKQSCGYYDPGNRPDRSQQDRRCNEVRRALVKDAGCVFGNNRASSAELTDCGRKITEKFAPNSGGGSEPADGDPALDCVKNPNKCDLIAKYINPIIGFLSAAVGIAVTIGIVSGGIRYAGAADDPSKMSAAKKQIAGAIVALVAYIFLYLILKWLAPGLK